MICMQLGRDAIPHAVIFGRPIFLLWTGQVSLERADYGMQSSDADEGNVAAVHALTGKTSLPPCWRGQQRRSVPHPRREKYAS